MSFVVLPRYHRQRFLLQFIEVAGGSISKIDLQELLFLAHQETELGYFDFVPYQYGCYSFQATADLGVLEKLGWLKISNNKITLTDKISEYSSVKQSDKTLINLFMSSRKKLRGEALIKHLSERYPYFVKNDRIAHHNISAPSATHKTCDGKTLFTIGYEGISFETYVNKLIDNDIQVVCDVRKNPLSRKFGFSKGIMSKILPELGIKYLHIPELGIVSQMRKSLKNYSDYVDLFEQYDKKLPSKNSYLQQISSLITKQNNVALTCFESDAAYCHRSYIGQYMETNFHYKPVHL